MKKISSIFRKICIFILIFSFLFIGGTSVYAADNNQKDYMEEKTYCAATIEDDFADDRVLVVLNKETSQDFKAYKTNDFYGVGCSKITDLTQATGEIVRNRLLTGKSASKNSRS